MIIETNNMLPRQARPPVPGAAGGIDQAAHLPADKLACFSVSGIYDIDREKAVRTATDFDIPLVYYNMEDMLAR